MTLGLSIKRHFRIAVAIPLLGGLLSSSGEIEANSQYPPSTITATAALTKSTYLHGESIFLVVRRINNMSSDAFVERLYPMHNLELAVIDERGRKLPHTGLQLSLVGPLGRTRVVPGDTVFEVFNLAFEFGTPLLTGALSKGFSTGKYNLIAQCTEANGTVMLPNLEFSVIEPPDEERGAFNSWIGFETARRNAGRQSAREILYDFIENFPESQYFPDVCHKLWVLDGAREQHWSKLLIDRFPNSGYAWQATGVYINSLPDAGRAMHFDSLSQLHPGTLVDEYVKYRRNVNYQRPEQEDK